MPSGKNLRRAAVLLASIPRDDAATLIEGLEGDQLDVISWAAANLGTLVRREQDALVSVLAESKSHTLPFQDSSTEAHSMDSELATARRELAMAEPDLLLLLLRGELPQMIAVVVCELPCEVAARIVKDLPTDLQLAVVQRVAEFESPGTRVVAAVCRALATKVRNLSRRAGAARGGAAIVAEMLGHVDHATERALLENLAQENRPLMERILQFMFVFRDLNRVAVAPTHSQVGPQVEDPVNCSPYSSHST